jgi:hypothetical protein
MTAVDAARGPAQAQVQADRAPARLRDQGKKPTGTSPSVLYAH